jgi:hypothetical protein
MGFAAEDCDGNAVASIVGAAFPVELCACAEIAASKKSPEQRSLAAIRRIGLLPIVIRTVAKGLP